MKKLLTAFFILPLNLFGYNLCNLNLSSESIDFDTNYSGETKQFELNLSNISDKYNAITIEEIKILSRFDVFKIVDSKSFTLNIGESKSITFEYSDIHNLTSFGSAFVRVKCGNNNFSIALPLKGKTVYKDEIYSFTQDLWEDDLRNALTQFVKKHKSLTYSQARILMWSSFDRINENVECVYTGKKTYVSDEPNFSELDQYGWNTEHTWPQAYGASNDPERSDLFHIFITDKNANSKRDNFPFGFVKSGITWQEGGSKLGSDDKGTKVFEPRDVHKCNVARALFYFATKYGNKSNFLTSQETAMREFMKIDPPDDRELAKNDSIFKYQENRNPYIDHPEFVSRIPSIAVGGSFAKISDLKAVDQKISVELKNNDSTIVPIYFYNIGNTELKNAQINYSTDGSDFSISGDLSNFSNVANLQGMYVKVKGNPSPNTKGIVEVIDSDSKKHLVEITTGAFSSVDNNQTNNISITVNPNPVFEIANISISGLNSSSFKSTLKIYNLLGEEVLDLTNHLLNSNQISINKNDIKAHSNVFIIKFVNGEYSQTEKLVIY